MSPSSKTPSERRRRQGAPKRIKAKPAFTRPREWAEQELLGVRGWITRLAGEEGDSYPKDWRKGQLRHYRARARDLRREIQGHKDSESKAG